MYMCVSGVLPTLLVFIIMEYTEVLNSWGLEDHILEFLEQGITDESFPLIDDETINFIFKKIGPKLIFKNKYQEYLLANQKIILDIHDDDRTFATSTPRSSTFDGSFDNSTAELIRALEESSNDHTHDQPSTSKIHAQDQDTSNMMSVLIPEDRIEEATPPRKKFKSTVFPEGLENILNSTAEGRLVLINRRKLTNDLRQKLVKIVINHVLISRGSISNEIKKEELVECAEQITKLFPSEEMDTYYVPYSSKTKFGLRVPARGKLWSRYLNIKAALRVANRSLVPKTSNCDQENLSHSPLEDEKKDLNFLKSAVEPYVRIVQAWENTFKIRTRLYSNKESPTSSLYDMFPCLKSGFGIELLESDFNQIFPDKTDLIYDQWPSIRDAILKEAGERSVRLTRGAPDTQALLVLPCLFNPVTLRKSPKLNWRPTRQEIQNSFFVVIQEYSELDEILQRRHATLIKYNLPLQPFGIVVGDLEHPTEFGMVCFEHRYKCDSAIRCLELLYKAIHALNLEYPPESKHVWHFIQEMVFQMPIKAKSTSTSSFISDIKFHLNRAV